MPGVKWTYKVLSKQCLYISADMEFHKCHNIWKCTFLQLHPAKIPIRLHIRAVWSESSMCAFFNSQGCEVSSLSQRRFYQTALVRRLIWGFVVRTCQKVRFLTLWLISYHCLTTVEFFVGLFPELARGFQGTENRWSKQYTRLIISKFLRQKKLGYENYFSRMPLKYIILFVLFRFYITFITFLVISWCLDETGSSMLI